MSKAVVPAVFHDTNAVVTGASSGIGRAIAIALARSGVERIVIHYRRNRRGAESTAMECEKHGASAILRSVDLADFDAIEPFVEQLWQAVGTVDTWVNNAGVDVLTGDAASDQFSGKLRRLLQVDVLGTIELSRLAIDRMKRQATAATPSMTFIGWDQSSEGMQGEAGQLFGPVKAAVTAFAKSLAQDAAPKVRVNTIAPGWIRTAWGQTADPYWDRRAKAESLMSRWGTPDDVAQAVLFAADPANSFLTAQTIAVNGGWNRHPNC